MTAAEDRILSGVVLCTRCLSEEHCLICSGCWNSHADWCGNYMPATPSYDYLQYYKIEYLKNDPEFFQVRLTSGEIFLRKYGTIPDTEIHRWTNPDGFVLRIGGTKPHGYEQSNSS